MEFIAANAAQSRTREKRRTKKKIMEFAILDFIQEHLRTGIGDMLFPAISWIGNNGMVWILLSVILLNIPKTRNLGIAVAGAIIIEFICCNLVLKPLVARPRPCEVSTAIQLMIAQPMDYSFPSGHTGSSFAAAFALYFKKSRLWIPSTILALLIGFSRLYLYVHYPSDVICGALLGILSGFLSVLILKMIYRAQKSLEAV